MTWSKIAILGALGAVCTAVGVGMGGCTVNSTTTNNVGDGGTTNYDSGNNPGDSSTTYPDTSTTADTSTGDTSTGDDGGQACPALGTAALFTPQACDDCTRQKCCTPETTCHSDTPCWTMETCFANCKAGDAGGEPDDAGFTPCDYTCFSTDDAGTTVTNEWSAFDSCQTQYCKTECGL
jgi:hypothetical protein